jgi:hypothetical protein
MMQTKPTKEYSFLIAKFTVYWLLCSFFGWSPGLWILCADVSEHCQFHLSSWSQGNHKKRKNKQKNTSFLDQDTMWYEITILIICYFYYIVKSARIYTDVPPNASFSAFHVPWHTHIGIYAMLAITRLNAIHMNDVIIFVSCRMQ